MKFKALAVGAAIAAALCAAAAHDASAQGRRWDYNESKEEMFSKCSNLRGIYPWYMGVTVPKEVYKDLDYYTGVKVDRKEITSSPSKDVTIIRYQRPFELEGVYVNGAEWIFHKGILVEMTLGLRDNSLFARYVSNYGEGIGYKIVPDDGGEVVFEHKRVWTGHDAEMLYENTVYKKGHEISDGIIQTQDDNHCTTWYVRVFDKGQEGQAYRRMTRNG